MKKAIIIVGVLLIAAAAIVFYFNSNNQKDGDLKEKIGQMLIVGFRGTEVDENSKIIQDIKKYNLGGIILFNYDVPSKSSVRNIEDPGQLKSLIQGLKDLGKDDLFIAVDAEGGVVNRLKFFPIPSAEEMGKGNVSETYANALMLAEELKDLGFNLNFAPVVDVNINPDNPVIGGLGRSFSEDPEIVCEHSQKFIEAMHAYGILTAIKHFPGHGSSRDDSHLNMVDITDTYEKETELFPYKKLIEDNNLDMIMTAHVMNRSIDEKYPATLSPLFLKNILREELGFNGVIVSDDMQMGAIAENYGYAEAVIRAINSGCNILILSNNNETYDEDIAGKTVEIIEKAVEDGLIEKETIENSYEKIMLLKEKI